MRFHLTPVRKVKSNNRSDSSSEDANEENPDPLLVGVQTYIVIIETNTVFP